MAEAWRVEHQEIRLATIPQMHSGTKFNGKQDGTEVSLHEHLYMLVVSYTVVVKYLGLE